MYSLLPPKKLAPANPGKGRKMTFPDGTNIIFVADFVVNR
jgi:hypothetical protein